MSAVLALGFMSGTSLDGIDAALIETDGVDLIRPIAARTLPYAAEERATLDRAVARALEMALPGSDPAIREAEVLLTHAHAALGRALLEEAGIAPNRVTVAGFHGQTVAHRPTSGWTWQIGDGAALADALGIAVIDQFRTADVAAGGQGAPLLPVYHRALVAAEPKPIAILNLGGVGNLTWIGAGEEELIAFDTGPANGLIDAWVAECSGLAFDRDGALAAVGAVHASILDGMLDNPWFDLPAPKSLDRHDFDMQAVRGLGTADGAATLTRFTAETVALALRQLPAVPRRLLVAGGGRHNPVLLRMIGEACGIVPEPLETLGRDGDATEAEGFAYMAVRALGGLPISFPGTTGAPQPLTGGTLHRLSG